MINISAAMTSAAVNSFTGEYIKSCSRGRLGYITAQLLPLASHQRSRRTAAEPRTRKASAAFIHSPPSKRRSDRGRGSQSITCPRASRSARFPAAPPSIIPQPLQNSGLQAHADLIQRTNNTNIMAMLAAVTAYGQAVRNSPNETPLLKLVSHPSRHAAYFVALSAVNENANAAMRRKTVDILGCTFLRKLRRLIAVFPRGRGQRPCKRQRRRRPFRIAERRGHQAERKCRI